MVRKSKLFILIAALALFVSACGGGGSSGTGSTGDGGGSGSGNEQTSGGEGNAAEGSGGTKEITFWTISLSPTFDDYINGVIADFEAQNPGVKVNWQDIPYDAVEQKTLTAAASNSLADVMNLNTDYLKKLAGLGALANMDELAGDVKDQYFEGVWSAGELKGVSYAIPWYLSNSVTLYNKELLEKAGFSEPPKTEEEAWEMSKAIKEKTGAYGFTTSGIQLTFPQEGIKVVSDDYTKAAFNTPEALELLKKFKQRYDEGLIPDELLLGQAKPNEWYAQEKIAFWATGPQLFRQVKDLSPEVYEKSDATGAIMGKSGKVNVAIMNIAVAESSKHKEEAAAFAKFITNGENQLAFSKIVAILPSVKSAAADEYFTKGADSTDPAEKGLYLAAKQLEYSENMYPPVENISQINKVLNEEFQKVLVQGKDPQQALNDAEAEVNKLLATE
ncbi:sugar ABC transporter substrate-binding protein [Paenibacillus cisolokensis]|uniref:Sugar ABC transporter substrate-binding protein n=1 Tax=Paenibacillus cisolokensis TaxID=1658519 RepID=A0ABQ4N9Q9_9BACL|nr:sugar ABC transporter substrate-binding protein [Paenibacillus cisolokensis]GIQ64925.1 sugar ABC transporter substrate-binding protein [Paenibacillus cisolokensis]